MNKYNIKYKDYKKNDYLFNQGDLCNKIAIIIYGEVKAIELYKDGHETIMRTLSSNDIIGISLIFSSSPYYKGSFIALSDTKVAIISKDELLLMMKENTDILNEVLTLISNSTIVLNERIKLMSHKTIKEKICAYLYTYYKKCGKSFTIEYTKTELAKLLNVERPSLSYELNKLVKENIITNKGKNYTIINLNKLTENL